MYVYVCVCVCIHGVTGGTDQTSGECSLGHTIPIYPKTPISKVQWLRRYWPEKFETLTAVLTYWLPNTYWNWQEYVVSVVLISVHNIKVTCEWHKAIKQNDKNTSPYVFRHSLAYHQGAPSCTKQLLNLKASFPSWALTNFTTVTYNCVLPDDGPVSPATCRSWCVVCGIVTLIQHRALVGLNCNKC